MGQAFLSSFQASASALWDAGAVFSYLSLVLQTLYQHRTAVAAFFEECYVHLPNVIRPSPSISPSTLTRSSYSILHLPFMALLYLSFHVKVAFLDCRPQMQGPLLSSSPQDPLNLAQCRVQLSLNKHFLNGQMFRKERGKCVFESGQQILCP